MTHKTSPAPARIPQEARIDWRPVLNPRGPWSALVTPGSGPERVAKHAAGLVYVSALSPDAGETTAQQYDGFTSPPEFVLDIGEDGYGYVAPESFQAGFAHDVSDVDAAFMRDAQVPINMDVFGTVLENAAWRSKPSWAVIATDDKAFAQKMLHHMADRIGAKVTEVSASHAVFMTQPTVVAETIDEAAREAVVPAN